MEAATLGNGGCNPIEQRLQPYATEAATPCKPRARRLTAACDAQRRPRSSARPTLPSYHPSQLRVTLNGGLEGLPALRAAAATPGLDGLMCGR